MGEDQIQGPKRKHTVLIGEEGSPEEPKEAGDGNDERTGEKRKRKTRRSKGGVSKVDGEEEEAGRRCFVGNLPPSTTREYIEAFIPDEFKKKVVPGGIKLARDPWDKTVFKGYAFVTFSSKKAADRFVAECNQTYWRLGDTKDDRSRKVNVQISPFFTKRGKCFYCGSGEHTRDKCTRNVNGFAGLTCYRCGETGHILTTCPQVAEAKKRKLERAQAAAAAS
ncbi:hypothetical protein DIPPA_34619 [Diplonema papillatum]|nr:hypothetical protein DIPPA_34619 [Diplonema papillatum]